MRTRSRWLVLVATGYLALPFSPTAAVTGDRPEELLGRPFATALDRYGPPDVGGGTTGLLQWRWRDDEKGWLVMAVHAGLVIQVDSSRQQGEITPRPIPATGAYPGQPVAQMLERLGSPVRAWACPPVSATPSGPPGPHGRPTYTADAIVKYGDGEWLIAAGLVLGPVPGLEPVNGPR
ncbi:MAG: hypothetical protein KDC98_23410 [Planctomycetes bacterium]|nr:hypothetical protein [Planctomycetota bacterium]